MRVGTNWNDKLSANKCWYIGACVYVGVCVCVCVYLLKNVGP